MAPEAFDDILPIKRGIDLWSFGILLNELFIEEKPYKGQGDKQIIHQLMKGNGPKIAPFV